MYLDEQNHCVWSALSEYSSPADMLQFVQKFPDADYSILRPFLDLALPAMQARADGKLRLAWSVNGEKQARSAEDLQHEQDEAKKNLVILKEIEKLLPWRGVIP